MGDDLAVHELAVESFVPMLNSLSALLDKAVAHVRAKGGNIAALLESRLAPDMFPLTVQVQFVCHHARDAMARLGGGEPPKLEKQELTLTGLKELIEDTIAAVSAIGPDQFRGAAQRRLAIPLPDLVFESTGAQFLYHWALPNFYFHFVTAYDILRHAGVDIGKRDYMAHAGRYIRSKNA